MIKYRVFISNDEGAYNRNCVRIFAEGQRQDAKKFAKEYCMTSGKGAVLEVIQYVNGKTYRLIYKATRKA